jgi:hypothetical protein
MNWSFACRTDFLIRPVLGDGLGNPSYKFAQIVLLHALIVHPLVTAVRRRILGIAALVVLVTGTVLWLWQPADGPLANYWQTSIAFCWRMGPLLAAAWLAFDDVQRLPGWLLLVLPVLAIVLVRVPRIFLLLLPALVLYAVARRFLMPAGRKNRR